jgi:2-oxoisovalerate ferredoxin oxidoreductase alpha subunit
MAPELIKGNEAIVKAAILAGCRSFYGYPITPASEITEAAARYFPLAGGTFLQAESEVAAINMVYGAAAAGERTMTASSGPGISLMQEGISYLAGAELPCVIADITRGGPGLGNIAPEQSDYNQVVKGGGHGNYHTLVLAPNSGQEMCDLTLRAFDLADRYRNPVIIMTDGVIGQMMEPVEFPGHPEQVPERPWAVTGTAATRRNLISSFHMSAEELEAHQQHLEEKYDRARRSETVYEEYLTADAELIVIGYGIVSRLLRSAVDQLRAVGRCVGLFRPISLWPFPELEIERLANRGQRFLVVELSNGQMVADVRLAVEGRSAVDLYTRVGGTIPSVPELMARMIQSLEVHHGDENLREASELLCRV